MIYCPIHHCKLLTDTTCKARLVKPKNWKKIQVKKPDVAWEELMKCKECKGGVSEPENWMKKLIADGVKAQMGLR